MERKLDLKAIFLTKPNTTKEKAGAFTEEESLQVCKWLSAREVAAIEISDKKSVIPLSIHRMTPIIKSMGFALPQK